MAKDPHAKQNVIAITDDVAERLVALQDLYNVNNTRADYNFIIDRALTVLFEQKDWDKTNDGK